MSLVETLTSAVRLTLLTQVYRSRNKEVRKSAVKALIWEKSFFFHFFASQLISSSVERFGNNDQLSKVVCPSLPLQTGGRGVFWGSQEGMIVLFTSYVFPSCFFFLSPSECTPLEVSQQGGILLFQDECTCYSKHPLSCFTLRWADRHESLCQWAKGQWRTFFSFFFF